MSPASRPSPQPPSASSCGDSAGGSFTLVHSDIIRAHVLSRLDGPSLASAACASSQLRSLCSEDELWRDVCAITWPSTTDLSLQDIISIFPSGFRSFYADAYPIVHLPSLLGNLFTPSLNIPTKLVSAIDIFYGDDVLFSKVQETEISTPWFMSFPFRIDLIEPKEFIKTPVPYLSQNHAEMLKHLEKNISLSWILIDPTNGRAVSLPSPQPVSVRGDWLGGIQVRFSSILWADREESEFVECRATLSCKGGVDGRMEVREVSMRMEDEDGRGLSGKCSLAILAAAMHAEKRRTKGTRGEGIAMKERFEEFSKKKRKRKETVKRREKAVDMACISVGIAVVAGFFLWVHALFNHYSS